MIRKIPESFDLDPWLDDVREFCVSVMASSNLERCTVCGNLETCDECIFTASLVEFKHFLLTVLRYDAEKGRSEKAQNK